MKHCHLFGTSKIRQIDDDTDETNKNDEKPNGDAPNQPSSVDTPRLGRGLAIGSRQVISTEVRPFMMSQVWLKTENSQIFFCRTV